MKLKSLLLTSLFAVVALSTSALGISLQYPFGANQVVIDQQDGIITLTILAPEEDEFADPYVATAPLGLVLNPESKTVEFEYTSTAPFKVTKVWYAPDGGQFFAEPDFEAESSLEASTDWASGSFSIAAGVEELGFGKSKSDWMRIDFEVEPGTVIKFRNLSIPGTEDPMQASPDGKVRKGYYLKLEAEDFNPGLKGETWYTNLWSEDDNVDFGPDWSYYLGKGYGFGEDDAQHDIAAHNEQGASNGRYLFGMGSFWHDPYTGGNDVNGTITFEEARNWYGAWFDYDFEVAEECDAKIDLGATSPFTIWRIMVDRDTDDNPEHNANYVHVEGMPEGSSYMATYTGCAQVALDGQILTSNQTKLPTVIDPRDYFNEHGYHTIWAYLGGDDGLSDGNREWLQKVWDDGFNDPEMWTKENPDPTIIHIFPNAESAESIKDVNQNHRIDTNEASFGFPFYTQHLTPGKHTLRVYSLAQKWFFDYIRIEGIGEPDAIRTILTQDTNMPAKVYDLNGMYMGNTTDGLRAGVYVMKKGNETKKVIVR